MSSGRRNDVAARIRAARAYADLKRADLGRQIGVSERQVTRLESGEAAASYELRQAVGAACRVPAWFMEDGFGGVPGAVSDVGRLAELEKRMDGYEALVTGYLGRELREGIQEALRDLDRPQGQDRPHTGQHTTGHE